jgi:O-antigen ligase
LTSAAWLAAALLSVGLGLLQYFGISAALAPWVNSTHTGEAFANLRQRNQFATLTNIGLAALLWWVAASPVQRLRSEKPTLAAQPREGFALFAAAWLAVGNAASSSRTGLVQLVLLLVLFGFWGGWRQPRMKVLAVAALAYAGAALALPVLAGLDPHASGILARLHDGDSACGSRLTLWGNVLHLIAQKPLLGWGWGSLDFAHFITLYPGTRFCEILDNAHNLPLQLAVELGVPAALAFCGVGVWLVWLAKPWAEKDASRQMAWAVIAVILLHSLLEYPLWYGPFQMAFALSVWLLARPRNPQIAMFQQAKPLARNLYALGATVSIGLMGYVAWDYQRVSQLYEQPSARMEAYRNNTLQKVSDSWLFRNQVLFATITTVDLSPDNALQMHDMSKALLYFSPEPRVIERLIESARLLGLIEEELFYRQLYQAAFPDNYAQWTKKKRG